MNDNTNNSKHSTIIKLVINNAAEARKENKPFSFHIFVKSEKCVCEREKLVQWCPKYIRTEVSLLYSLGLEVL